MKYKDYKIAKHNSTVNGDPGRYYDWAKFCWNGTEEHDYGNMKYSTESEFVPEEKKGQIIGIIKAMLPFRDGLSTAPGCEYLHIPYDWAENGTVYRVRPNDTMYAGKIYRGNLIKKQIAIEIDGIWYWRLYFEKETKECN